jgi:hypothetical protein
MSNISGFLKDASGNVLLPGTSAAKVSMLDAEGQDSTVQAEIVKNRQEIARMAGLDGLNIKGEVNGTDKTLPASDYKKGDAYVVSAAGVYAGHTCEVGDWLVCTAVSEPVADSDWTAIQVNLVNAVTGPASSTADNLMAFNSASGTVAKDSGLTTTDVSDAVSKKHEHSNDTELAKVGENSGQFTYDNVAIGNGIPVVNNGAAAPAGLLPNALYFEKDA